MFLIVDGSSLLNIQFYGQQNAVEEERKCASDAVINQITKLTTKYGIDHCCVVLDQSRETTFRKRMYLDYKAQRTTRPDELKEEMKSLIEKCKKKGIATIEHPLYEADDFAGTLTRMYSDKDYVILLTRDQDYLQLVSDKCTLWLIKTEKQVKELVDKYGSSFRVNNKTFAFTPEIVEKEYQLKPCQITDYKGLRGDSSDNIPGVKNLGQNAAIALLKKYQTLENIFFTIENTSENDLKAMWKSELGLGPAKYNNLVEQKELAFLSKRLATIYRYIPLQLSYDLFKSVHS